MRSLPLEAVELVKAFLFSRDSDPGGLSWDWTHHCVRKRSVILPTPYFYRGTNLRRLPGWVESPRVPPHLSLVVSCSIPLPLHAREREGR